MRSHRGRSVKFEFVTALCLAGCVLGGSAKTASAHGANIDLSEAVELTAKFDTGEPMSDAQVSIYSPNDPETPWAKGTTNSEGQFLFVPETSQPGTWEITVRKAGHGHTTTMAVEENQAIGGSALNAGQGQSASAPRWISMAAVVWGFVGTALFFSRRTPKSSEIETESQVSTAGGPT